MRAMPEVVLEEALPAAAVGAADAHVHRLLLPKRPDKARREGWPDRREVRLFRPTAPALTAAPHDSTEAHEAPAPHPPT